MVCYFVRVFLMVTYRLLKNTYPRVPRIPGCLKNSCANSAKKNKDVSYLIHQDCIHYLTFTKREDHRSPNEKQKTRVSKGTVQEMSDVPINCFAQKRTHLYNLPETNIAPESRPSQMESSLPTINFLGRVISHAGRWFETGPWHLAQVSSEHKHRCFFATRLAPKVTITSPSFRWFFANYFQTMKWSLKKNKIAWKGSHFKQILLFSHHVSMVFTQLTKTPGAHKTKDILQIFVGDGSENWRVSKGLKYMKVKQILRWQHGQIGLKYTQHILGGGFKYFFIFTPIWGRFPFRLCFKGKETTN